MNGENLPRDSVSAGELPPADPSPSDGSTDGDGDMNVGHRPAPVSIRPPDGVPDGSDTSATGSEPLAERLAPRPIRGVIIKGGVVAAACTVAAAFLPEWVYPLVIVVDLAISAYVAAVVAYRRSLVVGVAAAALLGSVVGLTTASGQWTVTEGRAFGDMVATDLLANMVGLGVAAAFYGFIVALIAVLVRRKRERKAQETVDQSDDLAVTRALRAMRHGTITAVGIAALMTVVVTIALVIDSDTQTVAVFADPWNYLDVIITALCGYGLHRRSRTAALVMLSYYVASRISLSVEWGRWVGGIIPLVVMYLFARATHGAFVYHRIMRARGAGVPTAAPWKVVLATLGTTTVVVFTAYGLLTQTGLVPDTSAVSGDQLQERHLAALQTEGFLGPDEEVVYFYSDGVFSILEDGNLFTADRVVSYVRGPNGFWSDSARFEEIIDIDTEFAGGLDGMLTNTQITVTTDEWRQFYLIVSPEGALDRAFASALIERWREVRITGDTLDEPQIWYDGGTGESHEDPVIILGARFDLMATLAAFDWLTLRYGYQDSDWELVDHVHRTLGSRHISEMTIALTDGEETTVFFDVTESFGKPPPDSWNDGQPVKRPRRAVALGAAGWRGRAV